MADTYQFYAYSGCLARSLTPSPLSQRERGS